MYVQNNPVIKFKQFHIKLNKNILYKDFFLFLFIGSNWLKIKVRRIVSITKLTKKHWINYKENKKFLSSLILYNKLQIHALILIKHELLHNKFFKNSRVQWASSS